MSTAQLQIYKAVSNLLFLFGCGRCVKLGNNKYNLCIGYWGLFVSQMETCGEMGPIFVEW